MKKILAEHPCDDDVMSMFVSTTVGLFNMRTSHLSVMEQDEEMELLINGMWELLALHQSMRN